jgi:hypothetical protein
MNTKRISQRIFVGSCPSCGRSEQEPCGDGIAVWYSPCPSDDCPSHAKHLDGKWPTGTWFQRRLAKLRIASAVDMLPAGQVPDPEL